MDSDLLARPLSINEELLWADLPANNDDFDWRAENRLMVRFGLKPDDRVLVGLIKEQTVILPPNWRTQTEWNWLHFRECSHFSRMGFRNNYGIQYTSEITSPFNNAREALWLADNKQN